MCRLYPLWKHPSEISTAFLLFFAFFSRFSGRSDIFRAVLHADGAQNAMGEFGMSNDIVLRNPRYFIERIFDFLWKIFLGLGQASPDIWLSMSENHFLKKQFDFWNKNIICFSSFFLAKMANFIFKFFENQLFEDHKMFFKTFLYFQIRRIILNTVFWKYKQILSFDAPTIKIW